MNGLWLLLGLALGAVLTGLLLRGRLRALTVESARSAELERELIGARADLEHERERASERLATLQDAQDRLSATFKALSAEALQASQSQLVELARAQLAAAQAEGKGDLERRQQAVEQLVGPLREQLGRVDAQLVKLDQERRDPRAGRDRREAEDRDGGAGDGAA